MLFNIVNYIEVDVVAILFSCKILLCCPYSSLALVLEWLNMNLLPVVLSEAGHFNH